MEYIEGKKSQSPNLIVIWHLLYSNFFLGPLTTTRSFVNEKHIFYNAFIVY